jgi:Domain of unknown function (DUF4159)
MRMRRMPRAILIVVVIGSVAGLCSAQFRNWDRGGADREYLVGNEPMEPLPADRAGVANWTPDAHYKNDLFTFVRLRFTTVPRSDYYGYGRGRGGTSWKNDWPTGDLNLSFRLQQLTSMRVDPNPIQMQITDPRLNDFPFAFMNQAGRMELADDEVIALRRYLLNGGFIMVSGLWGLDAEQNWADQMKRVFPDREQVDLSLDHPLFHCVFDLKAFPQVPAIQRWYRYAGTDSDPPTWGPPDDPLPHYRAIYDDNRRIMVLECANTDISDGWQREGDNEIYFHKFAETQSYPMVINIIFYAMTH